MRAATTTSARWVPALVAAALLLSVRPAASQAPAEVPEAVQREVRTAQETQARAVAEFEGPQQSRSIVAFDEVIARLEAVGPRALALDVTGAVLVYDDRAERVLRYR